MSTDVTAQYPEVSPAEAAALVELVRTACQPGTPPSRVQDVRDLLEFRITTCNRYLKRLCEWSERGLLMEVASVDHAYPELCKVAQRLSMPDLRLTWEVACEGAGVDLNTQIDERAFITVSDAVGDASSLEDVVQRFQLAVLGRRSLGTRMRCLRDLLARAPRNDALRNLTKRYESEALATLEASCRAAASRGETKPLRDALEAIDGFGWRGQLSESFCRWLEEELQRERRHSAKEAYSVLAARIEAAYAARDLSLLGSLTDEVDELEREQRVTPGDNFRVRIREAMSWAESEMARLRQLAAHSDACESLQQSLNTGTTAAEAEGLCSNILSTGLAVPDHLVERCRQLRADEVRSRQTKVAMIVVGFLLALGALVVIVIAVLR